MKLLVLAFVLASLLILGCTSNAQQTTTLPTASTIQTTTTQQTTTTNNYISADYSNFFDEMMKDLDTAGNATYSS